MIIISWPLTVVSVITVITVFFWLTKMVARYGQENQRPAGLQVRGDRDLRDRRRNVAESGTHDQLLRRGGLHAALYNEQYGGGQVQSRCHDGDIMANGSVRRRQPALA